MKIGSREFDIEHHTYVMGILNVTPDSLSDGGRYDTPEKAVQRVGEMIAEGAGIIDVGGESTRPGYQAVSEEEEIERVLPVIRQIKELYDVPVSVDTWKSAVAEAALKAGADMINDVSCMNDKEMAGIVAKYGCAYCLTHNGKEPVKPGDDVMQGVENDLAQALEYAWKAGIRPDRMMIDPGIGFAKDCGQNLKIMNRIDELHCFGLPIMLGVSRKSVIGETLDLPVEERLEGTLAATAYAVMKKCAFVRVHDVKENIRVIQMMEAILNG